MQDFHNWSDPEQGMIFMGINGSEPTVCMRYLSKWHGRTVFRNHSGTIVTDMDTMEMIRRGCKFHWGP